MSLSRYGRLASLLVVAGVALLVLSTAPSAFGVIYRSPTTFTTVALDWEYETNPLYGCFFTRGIHHPERPGRADVIVGYHNFYDSGTAPFACWEKIDHAYRGYIRFNFNRSRFFRAPPAVQYRRANFREAYLTFRLRSGRRVSGDVAFERAMWSAARRLGVLVSPWSTSGEDGRHVQRDAFHGVTLYHTLPIGKDLRADTTNLQITSSRVVTFFRIRVTGLMLEWVCGERPNHGFVLQGPNESYGENNNVFLSVYSGFRLHIQGEGTRRPRRC